MGNKRSKNEDPEYFYDEDFPHTDDSLLENNDNSEVEWIKAEEIFEDGELFGEISTDDVSQGSMGNCWFISAIAALAEFPDLVQNLFITQEIPEDGRYELQIFDLRTNEWESVEIDSYIPSLNKTPIYCTSNKNKLWPLLLEKAVAKFCGTYRNFGAYISGLVFPHLTGMRTVVFSREEVEITDRWKRSTHKFDIENGINYIDGTDEKYSLEELFDLLVEHNENEDIMTCSAYLYKIENDARGITASHVYSLTDAVRADDFMLLKLRNPWGYGEWEGDWCDDSELWEEYPEVKEALGFEPADDGSFWISLEDFSKRFDDITVCIRGDEIEDSSEYLGGDSDE
ncbi:MAG TPA: C2 family cysteine protease [Leptospiraceae bacterium]|nr:C2 family cysteine protease [Leptospiraceae bacterium]